MINSLYFYKKMINYLYQMKKYGKIIYFNWNNLLIKMDLGHQEIIINH